MNSNEDATVHCQDLMIDSETGLPFIRNLVLVLRNNKRV